MDYIQCYICLWPSLPNNNNLDYTEFKESTDNKMNNTQIMISICHRGEICRKRKKSWLPAFSPFPTTFSETFFFMDH